MPERNWPAFFRRLNVRLNRAGIFIWFEDRPYPQAGGEFTIYRPAGVEKEEGWRNAHNPFLEKVTTVNLGSREEALDWIDNWLTDERLAEFENQLYGFPSENETK